MAAKRPRATDLEQVTWEHVIAQEARRVAVIAPPWVAWVVILVMAAALHIAWPVPGAAAGVLGAGVLLALLDVHLTRHRRGLARWMAAATTLAVCGLLAAVDLAGLHSPEVATWAIGGSAAAFGWSKWLHIHEADDEQGMGRLFAQAAHVAGHQGVKVLGLKLDGGKAEATIQHAPGTVTAELVKAGASIESAARLPPGSVLITADRDRADRSKLVIADPRILDKPLPWPGPSRPQASIAEPLRLGRWQDGKPMEVTVPGWHHQVMGCTGSGKTLGVGMSEIAETVSRHDAVVVAFDITKGNQFLGPLRPALHALVTDPQEARRIIAGIRGFVRSRTDALAERGLHEWRPGCGLPHVTLHMEEAPDIVDLLTDAELEALVSGVRAARSGGVRWLFSLQRSDWTQLPTIVRGQLGKSCCGVLNDEDARFGLSPYQVEHGCDPTLWGNTHPGMTYTDAPVVPNDRKPMAWRSWYWGANADKIAEHAALFPAAERPLDQWTAALIAPPPPPPAEPQRERVVLRTAAPPERRTEAMNGDHDDDLLEGDDEFGLDDDLRGPPPQPSYDRDSEFGRHQFPESALPAPRERMTAEQARAEFRQQLAEWRVRQKDSFGIPDLAQLRRRTGRSRPWLYEVLAELEADGLVVRVDGQGSDPITWRIEHEGAA